MNFLIVLAVVLMVHQGEWIQYVQRDAWFGVWQQKTMQSAAWPRWLGLAMVIAPVLALAVVLYSLADYVWLTLVLNALVLAYAIGRGSWRTECDRWVKVFAEQDELVIKQRFAEQHHDVAGMPDGDVEAMWLRARSAVLYHQLDGFYTVVFWFFLLGAPMALLYRLLQLSRKQPISPVHKEETGVQLVTEVDIFLWLMEWIPVRLMGLLFCMVGNFTTGFWVLKQIARDGTLSSTDALERCADAALFLDGSTPEDETLTEEGARAAKMVERMEAQSAGQKTLAVMRRYSIELQALLHRSEWAFLVLLALTALV